MCQFSHPRLLTLLGPQDSLLAELVRRRGASAQVAFEAAAEGNAEGQRVVDEVAGYLAMGLISLLRLFDPDVIAIGGGMAQAGERLLLPVRLAVERMAPSATTLPERIVLTALGENAGLLGAGTVALRGASGR